MTKQERQEGAKLLGVYAKMYGRILENDTLTLIMNKLDDLSLPELISAMDQYSNDPKNRTFPVPAQIIAIARPQEDPRQEAIESASRIVEAVSRFGWNNPHSARTYIGELGWRCVKMFGGWQYICENLGTEISLTTFQAQIRNLAETTYERTLKGFDHAPGLPDARTTEINSRIESAPSGARGILELALGPNRDGRK